MNEVLSFCKQYCNRRILTVLFFGFSSGLPFALTASTLQAWLTVSGVGIVSIGLFSLVGQPYVYKFIWAPLFDRYIPPFLGRRRGWILVLQFALVCSIATMAYIKPNINPMLMAVLALLTAFFSSSQDIVINAYTTDILEKNERGIGAAMTVTGWRIAILFSGAIALVIASYIGWRDTYLIMSAIMLICIFATFFAPEPAFENHPVTLYAAVIEPLTEFIFRSGAIWILVFIVLYKLGDAFTVSLSTTFLLRGVHFNLIDVATVNKFGALIATIVGSVLGGLLLPRLKIFWSLFIFGFLQMFSSLLYMWLAIIGKQYFLMVVAVVSENFFTGMSSVAFVAFIMILCNHKYTATQFALLTAVSAIGRVFVGPVAGELVYHLGWIHFYLLSFFVGVPGLALLLFMRNKLTASPLCHKHDY